MPAESLGSLRRQTGICFNGDYAVTLVKLVSGVVTVVHPDIEDQISLHDCGLTRAWSKFRDASRGGSANSGWSVETCVKQKFKPSLLAGKEGFESSIPARALQQGACCRIMNQHLTRTPVASFAGLCGTLRNRLTQNPRKLRLARNRNPGHHRRAYVIARGRPTVHRFKGAAWLRAARSADRTSTRSSLRPVRPGSGTTSTATSSRRSSAPAGADA